MRVELSYEVKNKRDKLRCLLLQEKEKYLSFIYDVITWDFFYKLPSIHYYRGLKPRLIIGVPAL